MNYTQGIRKIFDTANMTAGSDIYDAGDMARHAGFRVMTFNGDIYVLLSDQSWQLTGARL